MSFFIQWDNDFVFDEENQEDSIGEGDEENKYYSESELEDDSVCWMLLTFANFLTFLKSFVRIYLSIYLLIDQ